MARVVVTDVARPRRRRRLLPGRGRLLLDQSFLASAAFVSASRTTSSPARSMEIDERIQILRRQRHGRRRWRESDSAAARRAGKSANSHAANNGLVRITFPLPPNIRLIDPATNAPSAETFVDVWRMVPTVNDVALTGPDGMNPWPRGPNMPAAISWMRASRRCRSRRSARSSITRRSRMRRRSSSSTIWRRSSACCSRTVACARSPTPSPRARRRCRARSAAQRARAAGKAVFERACAHCHGGPGQSTPHPGRLRFHDISPSARDRSIRSRRRGRLQAVPAAPGAQRADLRDHAPTARRGARAPIRAARSSRASSAARRRRRLEQVRRPGLRGISTLRRTSTTTAPPPSKRSSTTTSSSSSASRHSRRPQGRAAGRVHERRDLRLHPRPEPPLLATCEASASVWRTGRRALHFTRGCVTHRFGGN